MRTRTKTRRRPQLETLEGRALLATAGTLDPTFGTGGHAVTSFTSGNDFSLRMLLQADGKVVVAGHSFPNSFDLIRYNPDGNLDTSFGAGGKVTTPVRGYVEDVALYPDTAHPNAPKILVAAHPTSSTSPSPPPTMLLRYNADGSLDTSFGGTGKVTDASTFIVSGVKIQPDGKIVAAGSAYPTSGPTNGNGEAELERFNPDGSLDTSFGNGGRVITIYRPTAPQVGSYISEVAVQADGKLVTVGHSGDAYYGGDIVTLARYNPDGSLDTSFGTAGTGLVVLSQTPGSEYDVLIQPDGKILADGNLTVGGVGGHSAAARLNPDGTLDASFGSGGVAVISSSGTANFMALQTQGGTVTHILVGIGRYGTDIGVVARLNPGGSLDQSFGTGGLVSDGAFTSGRKDVAVQADGNVLVSGGTNPTGSRNSFLVARYLGSAQPVPQFVVTAQPPASVTAGAPFSLTVEATDASGNLLSSYNGTVTVGLQTGPAGAALGGTLTATASNGFATFSSLWLNKAAIGYKLSASGAGLAPAATSAIAVTPAAPAQLIFVNGPESVARGTPFVVEADIADAYGNVVTTATNTVTVSLASNPGGATLGGTTTATAVNGHVTFSNLTVNKRGRGYLIQISGAGLASTTTNPFNVT